MSAEPAAFECTLDGDTLTVAGQGLTEIPEDLSKRYGTDTKVSTLDLSFNDISSVDPARLSAFGPTLKTLVLDNNRLGNRQDFASAGLSSLRVLSVNNNEIDDADAFLESVAPLAATLRHLSMLKNPASPSPYFGGDGEDYARFRLYVISKLPKLEFLDTTQVTPRERAEALRRGALLKVAKPSAPPAATPEAGTQSGGGGGGAVAEEDHTQQLPELPQQLTEPGSAGAAHYGMCSYIYYGKQSEGNRFILNEDL